MKLKAFSLLVILILIPFSSVFGQGPLSFEEALEVALQNMAGQGYSWTSLNHCSGFTAVYIQQLGIPIGSDLQGLHSYIPDPEVFPNSSTTKQVTWFEFVDNNLAGDIVINYPVNYLLNNQDWEDLGIPIGSIIYFAEPIGHNGYNDYTHVAILSGYTEEGGPIFAEFAGGMGDGPQDGRTLDEVARGVYGLNYGEWDIEPYDRGVSTPDYLHITIVDVVELMSILRGEEDES